MTLWRAGEPLVLASKSTVRRHLLEAAGIPVEVCAADIDERGLEQAAMPAAPAKIAGVLAAAKAVAIRARHPGRLVLAADQTLSCEDRLYAKATSLAAARKQLAALRGRTHELHAAAAIQIGDRVVFEHVATARLTMRNFSDNFLEWYVSQAGDDVLTSIGGYKLEGIGVQLFGRIEGDYFTILGLPMLPILAFLRQRGALAE